jgi:hypothetical protein
VKTRKHFILKRSQDKATHVKLATAPSLSLAADHVRHPFDLPDRPPTAPRPTLYNGTIRERKRERERERERERKSER